MSKYLLHEGDREWEVKGACKDSLTKTLDFSSCQEAILLKLSVEVLRPVEVQKRGELCAMCLVQSSLKSSLSTS